MGGRIDDLEKSITDLMDQVRFVVLFFLFRAPPPREDLPVNLKTHYLLGWSRTRRLWSTTTRSSTRCTAAVMSRVVAVCRYTYTY